MLKRLLVLCILLLTLSVWAQNTSAVSVDWNPNDTTVSGIVEIRGTVDPQGLQSFFLEVAPFSPFGAVKPNWTPISLPASAPVVNGILGTWDTTANPDEVYQLRVHIVLDTGESVFYTIAPIAVSNSGAVFSAAPVTVIEEPDVEGRGTKTVPSFGSNVVANPSVDVEVGTHVLFLNEDTQAHLQDAGITWVKWQIPFRIGEELDLQVAQDRIQRSKEAGFKVLVSVIGEVHQLAERGASYYPIYAQFLAEVAAFDPNAIEVWNEMNLDREWPRGEIDPAAYAEMLRQAYEAIKLANPEVDVVTGALAPTGAEGFFGLDSVWNDDRYMQGMADAGVADYADCIGVHYNEGIVAPNLTTGDPRNYYPTQYLPSMLDRAALPFEAFDIPLCFTELGYLTPEGFGPLPESFNWASNTTLDQQAEWLQQAIEIVDEYERMSVDLVIIWNADFEQYDPDPQAGYAIIRPDGTCPACNSLKTILVGSTP